jgi:hypothetical protein
LTFFWKKKKKRRVEEVEVEHLGQVRIDSIGAKPAV